MVSSVLKKHPNIVGSIASGLCLIHCIATPFIFLASVEMVHDHHDHGHGHGNPAWWGAIDVIFLIISAIAIYWSAKNTSKKWMEVALWSCWAFMAFILINEKIHVVHLFEEIIYFPAISLIALHIINRQYCQCKDEAECCTT